MGVVLCMFFEFRWNVPQNTPVWCWPITTPFPFVSRDKHVPTFLLLIPSRDKLGCDPKYFFYFPSIGRSFAKPLTVASPFEPFSNGRAARDKNRVNFQRYMLNGSSHDDCLVRLASMPEIQARWFCRHHLHHPKYTL